MPDRFLQPSGTFSPGVMEDIQTKADSGLYRIRGYGTLRERRWATFDDLTFLPCSLTRIPLEGYREKCSTKTVLGTRFAEQPIELDIPIMITGMSWGALSWSISCSASRLNQFRRRTRLRISFFARFAAIVKSQVENFEPRR